MKPVAFNRNISYGYDVEVLEAYRETMARLRGETPSEVTTFRGGLDYARWYEMLNPSVHSGNNCSPTGVFTPPKAIHKAIHKASGAILMIVSLKLC